MLAIRGLRISDPVQTSSRALFLQFAIGLSESTLKVHSIMERALNSTLNRDTSGLKPSEGFQLLANIREVKKKQIAAQDRTQHPIRYFIMLACSSDSMNQRHVESLSRFARRRGVFKKRNGLFDGSNVNRKCYAGQCALVSVVSESETFWPGWGMLNRLQSASTATVSGLL